ncbi:MAG: glycosyltransferase [Muribaculaceae bacterium]|nr:glycosyltransferase [Muribaculaceae bacterium]
MKNSGSRKLTAVIPFLNEGEEVGRTVASVLEFARDKVEIIVINDGSNALYDYEEMLAPFPHVTYVRNEKRLGVAACRDMGVEMTKTPYFILLDAHMRFYREGWVDQITDLLDEDDRRIFCCQTKALEKDESDEIVPMRAKTAYGARINLTDENCLLDPKWRCIPDPDPESTVIDVPCVLGATYAGSRRYWKYLRGYEGLRLYGLEEPYISMKAWLEGGRCQLIKDIEVGHIYRRRFPYRVANDEIMYNRMLIASLLLPDDIKTRVFEACRRWNEAIYFRVNELLAENAGTIDELKEYYRSIRQRDFDFVKMMNITNIK